MVKVNGAFKFMALPPKWQDLRRPGIPLTPECMRHFTFMMTGATLVFTVSGCHEFEVWTLNLDCSCPSN